MYVQVPVIRAIIQLVAAATIRERRLFRSALAQVRLLFESGVYSRGASIRSYTVYAYLNTHCHLHYLSVCHGSVHTFSLDFQQGLSPSYPVSKAISAAANATKDMYNYGNNRNPKAVVPNDHAHFCYCSTEVATYVRTPQSGRQ